MSALLHLYLDQFLIFVLVLTRVGCLLMSLPVLGTASVPMHVRALLAVAISLVITPLYWGLSIPIPENLLDLSLLLVREAELGLALGLAVMILLSGMQLAGQVVSQISGLSLADVVNPSFDTTVPIFSQILEMLAVAIFFLVGGHRQVIDALLGSFTWMPPGQGRLPDDMVAALSAVAAESFEVGIRASAPVMVALLLSTLIVALVSRTLPQLNAVAVGLNFNSLIVLAVLAFGIGSAGWVFQEELSSVMEHVGQAFVPAEDQSTRTIGYR
ncbi:MAG TPA: flagellar biosynthetic protein FliR [Pirellulaceae bacterium]|nr:flagellar biosynthetic protein FliR [Pirellulaceae bacterium]